MDPKAGLGAGIEGAAAEGASQVELGGAAGGCCRSGWRDRGHRPVARREKRPQLAGPVAIREPDQEAAEHRKDRDLGKPLT
jgi:hypothetical protein